MRGRPDWLDRIGGPSLTSAPSFWLTLAYAFLVGFVSVADPGRTDPLRVGVVMLLAQAATFAVLLAARRLWLRRLEPPARGIPTLIVVLAATAVRGVVAGLGLAAIGVTATPNLAYRVPGSVLSMGVALILCDLAVGSARRHRERLESLEAGRGDLAAARAAAREEISAREDDLVRGVREEVAAELDALDLAGNPDAVRALSRVALEVVRPLSHSLARVPEEATPQRPAPRVRVRDVLADATVGCRVPAVGVAALLVLLAAPFPLYAFGTMLGVAVLAVTFAVCALALAAVCRVLTPVLPRWGVAVRAMLITGGLVLAGAVTAALTWALVRTHAGAPGLVAGQVILIPLLGWLTLLARAAEARRQEVEDELLAVHEDLRWELARLHEIDWRLRRMVARALHGPVQSAIGGAALRLDVALRAGPVDPALLGELRADIDRTLEVMGAAEAPRPLVDLVGELARTYAGVCAVGLSIPAEAAAALERDPVCASAANAITTEGAWDAVHHRACAEVRVGVRVHGERSVELVIDGQGADQPPAARGSAGLGTEILDDVALDWELTETGAGPRLRVVLPLLTAP